MHSEHLNPILRAINKSIHETGLNSECTNAISVQLSSLKVSSPKSKTFRTLPKKIFREVEKRFTTLLGIPEFLPQLCPETVRTPFSFVGFDQK